MENKREQQSPIIFKGGEIVAYRDPAVLYWKGCFHLFFTLVETEADGGVYMYLAKSKSRDLRHWSDPVKLTVRDRSKNYSSPGNLIRFQDKWVICFQSYCRENGEKYGNGRSRIYVMETVDLEHFTSPRLLLLKGETPAEELGRMIDPYLLEDRKEAGKWWCFYKQNGVSMSYSRDLVHWTYSGHADAGENVCVLVKDDVYYMFHSPPNGIGLLTSRDCKSWTPCGELITLGQKEWDWARGRLTAGAVVEIPDSENVGLPRYLMFFHGSGPEDEETMFDQFASIGIAWSCDLFHWEWPGKI